MAEAPTARRHLANDVFEKQMRIRFLCLSLLFTLTGSFGRAQSSNFVFPFGPTDKWEYDIFNNNDPWHPSHATLRLTKDTLMPNNITYKCLSDGFHTFFYLRRDSTKVIQYFSPDSTEFVRYNFSKKVGDTIAAIPRRFDTAFIRLSDDRLTTVFGESRRVLTFRSTDAMVWDDVVDSIGILGFNVLLEVAYSLTGALVNGKIYGTLTHVREGHGTFANTPSLSQNHPNPFNPITLIHFDLPTRCYVLLTIRNILGQPVATIIDGQKEAGSHKIEWNASQLASGVYFYTIEAGDFLQTKKMVLLR